MLEWVVLNFGDGEEGTRGLDTCYPMNRTRLVEAMANPENFSRGCCEIERPSELVLGEWEDRDHAQERYSAPG